MSWADEWIKAWRQEFEPDTVEPPETDTETGDGFMRQFKAAGNG